MRHYSGNYSCAKSHWNGEFYHVNNMVTIEKGDTLGAEDFGSLLEVKKVFDSERYISWVEYNKKEDKSFKKFCYNNCYRIKPKVIQWLKTNIKDQPSGGKAWCVGNDEYNSHGVLEFNLFFYRSKDALNFIKTWSIYKKPTGTYNQKTSVSKKLDPKTNRLVVEKITK